MLTFAYFKHRIVIQHAAGAGKVFRDARKIELAVVSKLEQHVKNVAALLIGLLISQCLESIIVFP